MYRRLISYFLFLICFCLVACQSKTSYSYQLKEEKAQIKEYLSRNGFFTVNSMPTTKLFLMVPQMYYLSTSGLYYHLDKAGTRDSTGCDTVAIGDRIVLRYKKWGLGTNSDTTSYWTTAESAYPVEFTYSAYASYSSTTCCTAWIEAIWYMRYNESEATIIVPADLGFADDQSPTLTPYAYKLKLQFQKQ